MIYALIGNQNCGKTTLFNQLTGSNQHVGNFPGVTVEKKEGRVRRTEDTVVDLPGIYSLSPYTAEEVVTRDFLVKERPDAVLNIVDATNIERNLYLTLQLIELQLPMVVALNMMDEVTASGGSIDIPALSRELGVEVVPISAARNQGISELVARIQKVAGERILPAKLDFCEGPVHRAIHGVTHLIEDHAAAAKIPARFAATKLIEGDRPTVEALQLNQNELETVEHVTSEMEDALGTDREAALADMRYSYIERLAALTVHKPEETREQQRSVRIDALLTHKVFAIPIFLGIMSLVFWLTFGLIGAVLSDWMAAGVQWVTDAADAALTSFDINPVIHSLIIDGAFTGVGSVLSFLPTIVVLFFFLSLLEDSGYMARVAFVMDKLLRKIGLSGRSFVPMLIGFGCSVPAIMATRTLSSQRDRKMTIILTPFMSCSAKLPIYAVFTSAFFPDSAALVMILLYITGILVGILYGLLLKSTLFRGQPVPFVMELPAYRMPAPKTIALHMWEKAKDFLHRAFTVIFIASLAVWFLQTMDLHLYVVADSADSMLAAVGTLVAPLFAPLGFGDWRAATALITGLSAKETVASTLAVLLGAANMDDLTPLLAGLFTPAQAFAFLTFTLLYMPCVAAFAAVRREYGSTVKAVGIMAAQTGVAWCVTFVVYRLAQLLL